MEFVVFVETARPVEPCKRAFDDSALGQHLEHVQLIAFDHLRVVSELLFGPADQFARVAAVDEDLGMLSRRQNWRISMAQAATRSWMPDECTITASRLPSVSTAMCRLRPLIFLPAS